MDTINTADATPNEPSDQTAASSEQPQAGGNVTAPATETPPGQLAPFPGATGSASAEPTHDEVLKSLVRKPGAAKLKDAKACGHPELNDVPGTITICDAAVEIQFPQHLLTVPKSAVVPV